jgi:hypothetical protein
MGAAIFSSLTHVSDVVCGGLAIHTKRAGFYHRDMDTSING